MSENIRGARGGVDDNSKERRWTLASDVSSYLTRRPRVGRHDHYKCNGDADGEYDRRYGKLRWRVSSRRNAAIDIGISSFPAGVRSSSTPVTVDFDALILIRKFSANNPADVSSATDPGRSGGFGKAGPVVAYWTCSTENSTSDDAVPADRRALVSGSTPGAVGRAGKRRQSHGQDHPSPTRCRKRRSSTGRIRSSKGRDVRRARNEHDLAALGIATLMFNLSYTPGVSLLCLLKHR